MESVLVILVGSTATIFALFTKRRFRRSAMGTLEPSVVLTRQENATKQNDMVVETPHTPHPLYPLCPLCPLRSSTASPDSITSNLTDPDNLRQNRIALDKLQRLVITAYVHLNGVTAFQSWRGFGTTVKELKEYQAMGHPLQDPLGVLFTTLLLIRRNKPTHEDFMLPPKDNILSEEVRRDAAAQLWVAQKIAMHTVAKHFGESVQALLTEFLEDDELPKDDKGWYQELGQLRKCEAKILIEEPLHVLSTHNPMVYAERELYHLLENKAITLENLFLLRGTFFFFLGTCLLNPWEEVLEKLFQTHHPRKIGNALVSVAITCLYSSGQIAIAYRAAYAKEVDEIALVLLKNALSSNAQYLRIGPYKIPGEPPKEGEHSGAAILVSPLVLKRAQRVFFECVIQGAVEII